MNPIYLANFIEEPYKVFDALLDLNWLEVTEARKEYFMSDTERYYTYGKPPYEREYKSKLYSPEVLEIQKALNKHFDADFNVCFLNRYDTQKHQLGWHADDSLTMDKQHPIAVVSFGAEREIWWKLQTEVGKIPENQKQKLANGSLFVMPAGFQDAYFHRIPKADHEVGCRISLTFRRYYDVTDKVMNRIAETPDLIETLRKSLESNDIV